MTWLWYLTLAFFIWTVTAIIDKIVIDNHVKSPLLYTLFPALVHLPVMAVFLLLPFSTGLTFPGWESIGILVSSGVVEFFLLYVLFVALEKDEISTVLPLGAISPIFTLGFSWLLLNEVLGVSELVAFPLLVVGSFLIATRVKKNFKLSFSPALLPLLGAAVVSALVMILWKSGVSHVDTVTSLFYSRVGLFVTGLGLILFTTKRSGLWRAWRSVTVPVRFIVVGNQAVALGGYVLIFMALAVGSTAIVHAADGIQYMMTFVLASIVAYFFPKHLKEDLSRGNLIRKFVGISIIAVGLAVLSGLVFGV